MPVEGAQTNRRALSDDELAREAGTSADYIRKLVAAGAIDVQPDGLHDVENLPRVRSTLALAAGGIDLDDLMAVVRAGALELDWVARLWAVGDPTGRTFADFAVSLGDRATLLPATYVAFGLAVPTPTAVMREDEEQAIVDFLDLWAMVSDRPDT